MYTLKIENTCSLASSTKLYNYLDNIVVRPYLADFKADKLNVDCDTGGTVTFTLTGGFAAKKKDYWIWMSVGGTFPGTPLNGYTIPLNYDLLFKLSIMYPTFPGTTAFTGKLNAMGMAQATFTLPQDSTKSFVGFPINFAYVLMNSPMKLPIIHVSKPVHIKYVP